MTTTEPSRLDPRPAQGDSRRESTIAGLLRHPVATGLLAFAAVILAGVYFSGDGAFLRWTTHRDALRQASVYGILGCGLTLVILTAGIDLSVGSVLALTAVCFATFSIHWGWSMGPAVLASLAIATACGVVSGLLIAHGGIQPFIVTLAAMVFARGLAKTVSGGMKVSTAVQSPDGEFRYVELPPAFEMIDSALFGGHVALVTVVFLACIVLCAILLYRLRWGRYLYAVGGNETAARYSGLPVARVKTLAYALSGLFAGVAGICQAAQEQQGDPEAGMGYELQAIAIVVIGGTSLMGGRGGIGLTLLGTMIIGYLDKILSINAVPEASRLMLTGAIIVVAVLVQRPRRA